MRILILTQYFWPENFRINDLALELAARGHAVTVLTAIPNYPDGKVFDTFRADPSHFSSFQGIRVLRVPILPRGQGGLRLALNYLSFVVSGVTVGAWKLRGEHFDVVLSVMLSPPTAAIPAVLQRRLKRLPHLTWVLDLWPESLSAVGAIKSPWILKSIGKLVGFIYRKTDVVLVQSRSFFGNVAKYGGLDTRVEYLPAWAEAIFDGDLLGIPLAPELIPYKDTFNILFAGNIGEGQDFPAILDAAELIRHRSDIRWIIVGDGRKAEWVDAEISRRGLTERVVMLGRHPIERMPSFFRGAGALLVSLRPDPIFASTIPGKVQAYLASGVPLLAMLDGEGARIIDEAGAGFVVPAGDAAGLARQAEALATMSAAERDALGQRGREYCAREFNRDKLVSRLESWMRACIDVPVVRSAE